MTTVPRMLVVPVDKSAAVTQQLSYNSATCIVYIQVVLTVQPVSLLFVCPSSPDSTQRALSTGGTGGGDVVGQVWHGALAGSATVNTA